MRRLHRSWNDGEGRARGRGHSEGDARHAGNDAMARRHGLVAAVFAASLVVVVAAAFASALIYQAGAAAGPSITRYQFTTNVSGANASGTYYAFWRDGDTVWSSALVVDPNGSGTLKVEAFDASGAIDPAAVVEAEDDDQLVWTQDGTVVTLTSAEGRHTLPDGHNDFRVTGTDGARTLVPLDESYPDAVFYEDFEQAIANMQTL